MSLVRSWPRSRRLLWLTLVALLLAGSVGLLTASAAADGSHVAQSNALVTGDQIESDATNDTVERPDVDTLEPASLETAGPELRGDVHDLGDADETSAWFEYRQPGADNWWTVVDDRHVSADGDYWPYPGGHAHDNSYAHLNTPIEPGDSVDLLYYGADSGATLRPHLRDDEYAADGSVDSFWSGDNLNVVPDGETVRLRVENLGGEVNIYVDGERTWTTEDVSHETVFFSSYEHGGDSADDSLRLLGSPVTVDEPGEFSVGVQLGQQLSPDTEYEVRAVVDGESDDSVEFETGSPVETTPGSDLDTAGPQLHGTVELGELEAAEAWFEYRESDALEWRETQSTTVTDDGEFTVTEPLASNTTYEVRAVVDGLTGNAVTVETHETVATSPGSGHDTMGPTLRGEIDDLGGHEQTSAWFEYRQPDADNWWTVVDDRHVSADGDYWPYPGGHAHDNSYAHLNTPIEPGDSVDLLYYGADSGATLRPHLRQSEYEADGSVDSFWSGDNLNVVPDGETVRLRVENLGGEVNIYVDGERTWTTEDVSHETVFFSSYEHGGDSADDSLRLLGSPVTVDEPGEFSVDVQLGQQLSPDTEYEVRAVVDGESDDPHGFETGSPVETTETTDLDTAGSQLHGSVELGELEAAEAWFEYRESDDLHWSVTPSTTVTEDGEFTVTQPLASNTTYDVRAVVEDVRGEAWTVHTDETVGTRQTIDSDTMGPRLRGEIDDLGGHEQTSAWFEYRQPDADNWWTVVDDRHVSADGDYWPYPGGHAHDNSYAHLNTPIEPGDSVDLLYYGADSGATLRPHLRQSEYEADGSVDSFWSGDNLNVVPDGETVRLRVENLGGEVNIYVDGERTWTTEDVSHETVFFSSYEHGGDSADDSLRLLGSPVALDEPGEYEIDVQMGHQFSPDTEYEVRAVVDGASDDPLGLETGSPVTTVEATDLDTAGPRLHGHVDLGGLDFADAWFEYREVGNLQWEQTATTSVSESGGFAVTQPLNADTQYEVRAVVEGVSGDPMYVETGSTVDTRSATNLNTMSPTLRGEIDDLGGHEQTSAWFEYRQPDADNWWTVVDDRHVSADGDYWPYPGGHAHDNSYAHLNTPIEPGDSVDFLYYGADSGATLRPHLRDDEYAADGSVDSFWSGDNLNVVPDGETVRLRVENLGGEVNIYVDGERIWTTEDVPHETVFFSSYEHGGDSADDSLRLLGSPVTVDEPGEFSVDVQLGQQLSPDTEYEVRAVVDGATDDPVGFETGNPVETRAATHVDSSEPRLHGTVDLGDRDAAEAWFEYRQDADEAWRQTSATTVSESGEFSVNASLDPDAHYEFRAVVADVAGAPLSLETGDTASFDVSVAVDPESATTGEALVVDYRVENVGQVSGQTDLVVELGGEPIVDRTVELAAADAHADTVTAVVEAEHRPQVAVEARADGSVATEIVTVADPPADQRVSLDHDLSVEPGGEMELVVETEHSAGTRVAVEADGFDVLLDSEDAVETEDGVVEFLDPSENDSTYTVQADVRGGSVGDVAEIVAWVDAENRSDAEHVATSAVELQGEHVSGVELPVWNAVTDQNDPHATLTFQDLVDAILAYQGDRQVGDVEVGFQDLVDLIQWYQRGVP